MTLLTIRIPVQDKHRSKLRNNRQKKKKKVNEASRPPM